MNESINKRVVIIGIFVFVGLVFLGAGIFIVGSLHKAFEKKIELVSLFEDVAGLQRGNNIWLSGMKVGIVSDMAFYGTSRVKVTMQIEATAKKYIPVDSKVKISSDGFIGNRILVIYGGSENVKDVEEGDTLKVEKTISSEDMMNTLQKSNENILEITTDLKMIAKKIVNNEGSVGKLLNDNSLYENINESAISLQKTLVKAQQMVNSLASFSANLNKEGTLINKLTTDTVVFNSINSSVLELQKIANDASTLISKISQDASNQTSPIGVLLNDEKTGSQLKETIKNLDSSSKKLDVDLEALQHSFLLKGYFKKKDKALSADSTGK